MSICSLDSLVSLSENTGLHSILTFVIARIWERSDSILVILISPSRSQLYKDS